MTTTNITASAALRGRGDTTRERASLVREREALVDQMVLLQQSKPEGWFTTYKAAESRLLVVTQRLDAIDRPQRVSRAA
jgi:hypothetical protein